MDEVAQISPDEAIEYRKLLRGEKSSISAKDAVNNPRMLVAAYLYEFILAQEPSVIRNVQDYSMGLNGKSIKNVNLKLKEEGENNWVYSEDPHYRAIETSRQRRDLLNIIMIEFYRQAIINSNEGSLPRFESSKKSQEVPFNPSLHKIAVPINPNLINSHAVEEIRSALLRTSEGIKGEASNPEQIEEERRALVNNLLSYF